MNDGKHISLDNAANLLQIKDSLHNNALYGCVDGDERRKELLTLERTDLRGDVKTLAINRERVVKAKVIKAFPKYFTTHTPRIFASPPMKHSLEFLQTRTKIFWD
jgi:hypothetical protein